MNYYFLEFLPNNDSYVAEDWKMFRLSRDFLATHEKFEGKRLDLTHFEVVLPRARGTLLEYLDNLKLMLILREDVVEVLGNFSAEHIEIYPVAVDRKNPSSYFYVHTLNNVDAVDDDASGVVCPIPNLRIYSEIKHLKLVKAKVAERHLFRLSTFKTKLVVSEELKQALEQLPLEITNFVPCEGYAYPQDDWAWLKGGNP